MKTRRKMILYIELKTVAVLSILCILLRVLFCSTQSRRRPNPHSCARREKKAFWTIVRPPRLAAAQAFGACQSVRRVRAKAARDGRDGEASEGDRRLQQDDEVRHRDGRAHLQAPPVGEVRPREEEVHGCVRGAPWDPQTPLAIKKRDRTHRRRVRWFPSPPRAPPSSLCFASRADL